MKIKKFFHNYFLDLRRISPIVLTLFCLTIVVMNILANKTIYQNDYIAIDGGIVITWLAIVLMDIVTVAYGGKTAMKMSVFGIFLSLIASLIFFLVSIIPTSEDFSAFSKVLGGTWFIIVSGAIAFIMSSALNILLNIGIGKLFKNNESKIAYVCRCHISTLISQIFDNLVFNLFAFMLFAPIFWDGFHWTFIQCLCCALLYGAIQLVIETIFFPLGYRIFKHLKYGTKKE